MGWVVKATPRSLYPSGKTPCPFYRRLVGPVWTGAENVAPTGIRYLEHPTRKWVYKLTVCKGDYVRLFVRPFEYFTCRADGPVDNIKVFSRLLQVPTTEKQYFKERVYPKSTCFFFSVPLFNCFCPTFFI
jgi:hypothetical protein